MNSKVKRVNTILDCLLFHVSISRCVTLDALSRIDFASGNSSFSSRAKYSWCCFAASKPKRVIIFMKYDSRVLTFNISSIREFS